MRRKIRIRSRLEVPEDERPRRSDSPACRIIGHRSVGIGYRVGSEPQDLFVTRTFIRDARGWRG